MLGLAGRITVAVAIVIAFVAGTVAAPSAPAPVLLKTVAARSGRWFGTDLDDHGLPSPVYRDRLHEFSLIEAWSSWAEVEPCEGCWRWAALDKRVATITQAGAGVKSSALLWAHEPSPGYLTPAYLGKLDAAQLRAEMRSHIETIIHRYPQVKVWTIANEPFRTPDRHGTVVMHEDNPFQRTLGPGWIREALVDAYDANPRATFVAINEINADGVNAKSDQVWDYYRTRLLDAIPRGHLAVGLQMHLNSCGWFLDPTASDIGANMSRFANLGVQVHVTEMDFAMQCAGPTRADRLAVQERAFHDVAAQCVAISRCRSMSVWGVGDGDSWYRWQLHMGDAPLLFDDDYGKKPAYFGVIDGLSGR